MPQPILYFVRHGETDWNASAGCRASTISRSMRSAARKRRAAARCCASCSAKGSLPAPDYDYVSSPLGRARETMELMRARWASIRPAYRTDARLMEMSFGRWEGFTYADLQTREAEALAARERDKWGFVLPGGESYAQLEKRVQVWYESIARATRGRRRMAACAAR